MVRYVELRTAIEDFRDSTLDALVRDFKPPDPPKSPLKRGTLTEFSPLFKAGAHARSWGDLNLTGKSENTPQKKPHRFFNVLGMGIPRLE